MAYIFPPSPFDGELYPVPAIPGSLQYQWSAASRVWFIYSPLGVQSVTGILPISVSNGTENAIVSIIPASINNPGSMSAADKVKLDNLPANAGVGTVTSIQLGAGLTGTPSQTITTTGQINLSPATKTTEGGVIVGDNIEVNSAGVISVPTARFGVQSINVGSGLVGNPSPITNTGTISAALATRLSVGSVRVGVGIDVALDGTISIAGSLTRANILAYANIRVEVDTPAPLFTTLESFNIASVEWNASGLYGAPFVNIAFQNSLPNTVYGFAWGAEGGIYPPTIGGTVANKAFILRAVTRSVSSIGIALTTISTDSWSVSSNNRFTWNNWVNSSPQISGAPSSFDIIIVDTPVF
jgi:hypothetical protein